MEKANRDKCKWCFFSALTVMFFLILLEILHPYYFLHDDNLNSQIAVYIHTVESFFHGEWAAYNFHQFMGVRFLSHGQTGSFSIITYLAYGLSNLLLGHKYAMVDIVAIFHLTMSAIGMFCLMDKIVKSNTVSYIASVAWALNSFTVYLGRSWLVVIIVAGFFPSLIHFTINYLEKPSCKSFLLSVIWKAYTFYCVGHPQFFAYAIIVDALFSLPYVTAVLHKSLKTTLIRYALSSLAMFFLTMPLSIPMYQAISSSVNRSDSFSFVDMTAGKDNPFCVLVALLFPFLPIGGTTPFFSEFEVHAGHIGFVLALAIPIGLGYLYKDKKMSAEKKESCKNNEYRKRVLLSLLPVLIITLLYGCSDLFLKVLSYVPIINHFRWPMKIIEFFLFFLIIFGAVLFDYVFEKISSTKSDIWKRVSVMVLIVANIANFIGLYYFFTPQLMGLNSNTPIPFVEKGVDVIGRDRYACWFPIIDHSIPFDHNSSMAYNLATAYGMESYLGYDSIIPEAVFRQNPTLAFNHGGVLAYISEDMFQSMRECGVKWYVVFDGDERYVNDVYDKQELVLGREILEKNGCEILFRTENKVFYYDKKAAPVISCNNEEVQYEIHGNYISFTTDNQSEDGRVVIHFNYDDNLIAYVDGQKTEIQEMPDNSGIFIDIPEGEHDITIRYQDHFSINMCVCFSLFTICTIVGYCVIKRKMRQISR